MQGRSPPSAANKTVTGIATSGIPFVAVEDVDATTKRAVAEHRELQAESAARNELHAVARLDAPKTARTVRPRASGHEVTDGPFIEFEGVARWLLPR